MTEPRTPGKGMVDKMSTRTKAGRPRARNGNAPAPAEVATFESRAQNDSTSSFERVSYIRAFRVREWVRAASELRPRAGYPAVSVSRRRGQRLAS